MADFTDIIQEINTNLPDNTTQAITAAKLRKTLIDLTNAIDTVQDDFQQDISDELFDLVVDNLTSTSTTNALSANQGRILNETIDDVSHSVSDLSNRVTNLVVDNLTTEDATKALSANQGVVLNEKINNIPYELTNPTTVNVDFTSSGLTTFNFTIGPTTLTWVKLTPSNNRKCAIIPVSTGDIVFVESLNNSCHYGFLSSYPTPVAGESANLIGNTLYFLNTSAVPATSRTMTAPEGSMYIYVKMIEGTSTYVPSTMTLSSQKFLTDIDIVNSLDSDDEDKALSAAVGPIIKNLQNTIAKTWSPSVWQSDQFAYVIGFSNLNWVSGTNNKCCVIPVEAGDSIFIESVFNSCHYGFLPAYPTPVAGESANLIGSTLYFLNTSTTPATSRTTVAPEGAKYMYIKMYENATSFSPSNIEITRNEKVIIDSYYDDTEYETYIEEDIYRYNSAMTNSGNRLKLYKVTPGVNYKLILFMPSGTTNNVLFFNESMTQISGAFPGTSVDYLVEMEDITIPSGCAFIQLRVNMKTVSNQYTANGCGALMKPLKNDGSMPKNLNIYCVSKVKYPQMPYDYASGETTFSQTEVWSAWSFMFPYGANSITAAKFPIVSFFHGSTGFLTSEYMGYNSAATKDGIVGNLRANGCIVFDLNGYGISYNPSNASRHWGCPLAVETVKKAYEILVSRFNGRRGMVISGISMGGTIAKSYCMIHPEDVLACALEAPSDIGYTCRSSDAESVYKAWGYSSAEEMTSDQNRNAFIGYSPTIKPLVIQSDGSLKTMTNVMDYTSNQMRTSANINKFYAPFPVEIKIWHGDTDSNVNLTFSQGFVNMVRNANCNATLRLCPDCGHNLNTYPWVMNEVVNYIVDKVKI